MSILSRKESPVAQRKDYSALTKFLPPKYEYVMLVRLSPIQMDIYQAYLARQREQDGTMRGGKLFADYQTLMQIWTHPWVLKMSEIRQEEKKMCDSSDEDEDSLDSSVITCINETVSPVAISDSKTEGSKGVSQKKRYCDIQYASSLNCNKKEDCPEPKLGTKNLSRHKDSPSPETVEEVQPISREWWAQYMNSPDDQFRIDYAGKLVLLFEILKMCDDIGDKVLIFSQSLLSLDLIEDYLAYTDEDKVIRGEKDEKLVNGDATENKEKEKKEPEDAEMFGKTWVKGCDYYRMDGSTNVALHQQWADSFNDPENYRSIALHTNSFI